MDELPIISVYVDKRNMDNMWEIIKILAPQFQADAVLDKEDKNMFVLTKDTGRPYLKTRKGYSG